MASEKTRILLTIYNACKETQQEWARYVESHNRFEMILELSRAQRDRQRRYMMANIVLFFIAHILNILFVVWYGVTQQSMWLCVQMVLFGAIAILCSMDWGRYVERIHEAVDDMKQAHDAIQDLSKIIDEHKDKLEELN